jgi:hypothetical protein
MSEQDKQRLIREIRRAIDEQERRVRVTDIQVEFNNSNEVHIKIYGYFSLDRFGLVEDIGRLEQADLLVELNLATSQFNEQR